MTRLERNLSVRISFRLKDFNAGISRLGLAKDVLFIRNRHGRAKIKFGNLFGMEGKRIPRRLARRERNGNAVFGLVLPIERLGVDDLLHNALIPRLLIPE